MDPLYLDARAAAPRCVVRHADIGAPGLKLDRLEENHGGDLPRPRVLVGLAQQVYEAVAIRALARGSGWRCDRRGAAPKADLRVEPDELDDFVAEVQRLLVEAEALCAELGPAWEQRRLDHYLHNLLRAADYARVRKGGVTIS